MSGKQRYGEDRRSYRQRLLLVEGHDGLPRRALLGVELLLDDERLAGPLGDDADDPGRRTPGRVADPQPERPVAHDRALVGLDVGDHNARIVLEQRRAPDPVHFGSRQAGGEQIGRRTHGPPPGQRPQPARGVRLQAGRALEAARRVIAQAADLERRRVERAVPRRGPDSEGPGPGGLCAGHEPTLRPVQMLRADDVHFAPPWLSELCALADSGRLRRVGDEAR